jgi:hypothetical protein
MLSEMPQVKEQSHARASALEEAGVALKMQMAQ